MTIKKELGRGFTLIELLVVIAIIATLATVSVPFIQTAQVKARMTKSGTDARSVLFALTAYAAENAGIYPGAEKFSNDALRKLVPRHCDQESPFYVQSDRMFCDPSKAPDEGGEILAPGECHWAYVSGLTDNNRSSTPILADGFTDGIGRYDHYHAWDKLGTAIVGFLDGSIQPKEIAEDGEVKGPSGEGNLFQIPAIAEDDMVRILNPERPNRSQD